MSEPLGRNYDVDLGQCYSIRLTGTIPQKDYGAALGEYDIGLSLMLAPHPGVLTFEMASAGLIVVTNTFSARTEAVLREISGNIEPCEADLYAVAEALGKAVARMSDYSARVQNADFNWVRTWDDTFNPEIMGQISKMFNH